MHRPKTRHTLRINHQSIQRDGFEFGRNRSERKRLHTPLCGVMYVLFLFPSLQVNERVMHFAFRAIKSTNKGRMMYCTII
mmetsp:Transcript_14700/g.31378  ORF Transcript_14700/g.31378 Transcript_14700/m.31378 type:complete len:80 (+) Transcript_14700:1464-1703(+)